MERWCNVVEEGLKGTEWCRRISIALHDAIWYRQETVKRVPPLTVSSKGKVETSCGTRHVYARPLLGGLSQVADEVIAVLLLLEARERHLGTGNVLLTVS